MTEDNTTPENNQNQSATDGTQPDPSEPIATTGGAVERTSQTGDPGSVEGTEHAPETVTPNTVPPEQTTQPSLPDGTEVGTPQPPAEQAQPGSISDVPHQSVETTIAEQQRTDAALAEEQVAATNTIKVTVSGEVKATVEVASGSTFGAALKAAGQSANGLTFRDEKGKPVGVTRTLTEDVTITSVRKASGA